MERYVKFLLNPFAGVLVVRTRDYGRVARKIQRAIQTANRQLDIPFKPVAFSEGKASFEGVSFRKDELIKSIKDGLSQVFVFRNFAPFGEDEVIQYIEKYGAKTKIIIIDPEYQIPSRIRPYVEEVEDWFPVREEAKDLPYAEGLTLVELRRASHEGEVEKYRERILKQAGGILEIFRPSDVDTPIGLETAISAIESAFKSGIGKGTLLLGVPGTGKTLIAKHLSTRATVIRFNIGAVYSKYVGETEARLREALATLKLFGDCFVFIDEFEKAMAHGSGDSGVSRRVLGEILSWLQDKEVNNYVIATMNDISSLPPELVRPGRWDFIFSLLPPGRRVRGEISRYYAEKYSVPEDPGLLSENDVTPADIATLYRVARILGGDIAKARRFVKFTREVTPHFARTLEVARRYGVPVYEEEYEEEKEVVI